MTPNTEFLKKVSWFEDLDQRSLDAIANAAVEQSYQPGQDIIRQGDTGVGAFIIRSGKVDILQEKGGATTKLATLGPGDVIGEMALLDGAPRSANCTTVSAVQAAGLSRKGLETLIEQQPRTAAKLLVGLGARIAERLRALGDQLQMYAALVEDQQRTIEGLRGTRPSR